MEIAKVKAKSFLRLHSGDFEIPELVVAKIFFYFPELLFLNDFWKKVDKVKAK